MFVKVCGIRSEELIDGAADLGYSAVGFVLHRPSPRYCDPLTVKRLARYARNKIATVAVGISYNEIEDVVVEVDYSQLYQYRNTGRLIYASTEHPGDRDFAYFMFDASRGHGETAEFPEWLGEFRDRLIISGGLNRGNVKEIIRLHRPFGIDVSSGVEKIKGEKNIGMMREFIQEVRNAGG